MGTVENHTTVGSENDEVGDRAVHTNFANDREIYPLLSNPNLKTNIFLNMGDSHLQYITIHHTW